MIIDDNGFVIVHKDFIGTSSEIKKQHLVIKVRTNRLTFVSLFCITGRALLIRTRLIRSSTYFEVSLKSQFMFKMHSLFEHSKFEVLPTQRKFNWDLIKSSCYLKSYFEVCCNSK